MQVYWTKSASKDLAHIEAYIAKDKPRVAISTILKIIETAKLLTENPALGKPGRVVGTRELVIVETPYIVPYRIKNNAVEIIRVLHSNGTNLKILS